MRNRFKRLNSDTDNYTQINTLFERYVSGKEVFRIPYGQDLGHHLRGLEWRRNSLPSTINFEKESFLFCNTIAPWYREVIKDINKRFKNINIKIIKEKLLDVRLIEWNNIFRGIYSPTRRTFFYPVETGIGYDLNPKRFTVESDSVIKLPAVIMSLNTFPQYDKFSGMYVRDFFIKLIDSLSIFTGDFPLEMDTELPPLEYILSLKRYKSKYNKQAKLENIMLLDNIKLVNERLTLNNMAVRNFHTLSEATLEILSRDSENFWRYKVLVQGNFYYKYVKSRYRPILRHFPNQKSEVNRFIIKLCTPRGKTFHSEKEAQKIVDLINSRIPDQPASLEKRAF